MESALYRTMDPTTLSAYALATKRAGLLLRSDDAVTLLQSFVERLVQRGGDDKLWQSAQLRHFGAVAADTGERIQAEGHDLWRRKSINRDNRNHRPVSKHPEVGVWPFDVSAPHRDERYPSSERKGPRAGRIAQ